MTQINEVKADGLRVKEIPNFSKYLVDVTNGRIYRKATEATKGRWLKEIKPNAIGYCMTTLTSDEGIRERVYLHEIVMSAAIEFPKSWWNSKNLEIDHRNRNKAENGFYNLQLVTKSKNHENIANRKPAVRLTKEQVEYVRNEFAKWNGEKIQFYKTMSGKFNCVWQTIQYACLGYHHKQNEVID